MNMTNPVKYGVSLSGGGARGIIQLGILQALWDNSIKPEIVAGTSMGAINGALYAAGYTPKDIATILKENTSALSFSWISLVRSGFKSMNKLRDMLTHHIPENNFSALQYPLYISVTNLNSGKNELRNEGALIEYVVASASIPIVFKPQVINGTYYVDGGLTNNFPARVLQHKCEKIIGIHVNHIGYMKDIPNIVTLLERLYRVGIYSSVDAKIHLCDYYLDPPKARMFDTFDFHRISEIFDMGYEYGTSFASNINTSA